MISVIIPAYNEEKRIGKTLTKILREKVGEVIVVFDGKDNTPKIVKKFEKVKLLQFNRRLGKGKAIKRGFNSSKGNIVVFADADYGWQKTKIKKLTKWIGKYDIAIASRDRKSEKKISRKIASYGFNFLVKIILGLRLNDTQCGFKAFKRDVLADLFKRTKTNGYAFDAEMLYLAKNRYSIKEVPVKWNFEKNSKISILRDGIKMFVELLKIRWIHWKKKKN